MSKPAETQATAEQEEKPIPGFGLCRMVLYVPRESDGFRPNVDAVVGVIVRAWDKMTGLANLQLLPDGSNHVNSEAGRTQWVTSVPYSEDKTPGTWHFPPRE